MRHQALRLRELLRCLLDRSRQFGNPKLEEMKAALGREYLHTRALPTYTLGMALR
jgi:hypothetical protein